ncbi:MAG TPA: OsmC family protein [Candidatus Binataceae bacterium]|nr:OsmC family protein [Candidatus Binataceae bacterium]
MAITEKLVVPMKLQGTCPTHARTHVKSGIHEIVIDEPKSRGGTDMAPTPLETLIASLIGCTNVILNKIAEHNGIPVRSLAVEAEAMLDRRGTQLQEEVAIPFPNIKLVINLRTDADAGGIARLKSDLGRFCPVSKILRQSGTEIEEVWNVNQQ